MLDGYRRTYWNWRWRRGIDQIAVSGTHPEAVRIREELERQEERRERWLRRLRLWPPEQPSDDGAQELLGGAAAVVGLQRLEEGEDATLSGGLTWSSSQVALGIAGLALVLAVGCWFFAWMAIWRERARRRQRVKEAVFQWAGDAASKAELAELRQTAVQLSTQSSAEIAELRRIVSELADRLTSLEAEQQSRAESSPPVRRFR